jgi:hypothetical protein
VRSKKNERYQFDDGFWDGLVPWPFDSPGQMFLARAFNKIGQTIHREQWVEIVGEPEEPEDPGNDCDDSVKDQFASDCEKADADFQAKEARVREMREGVGEIIAEQCRLGNSKLPLGQTKAVR